MHITFTYSLIEETKNLFDMVFYNKEYKDLRSVVFPSLKGVVDAKLNQNKIVKEYTNIWKNIEPKFNETLVTAELIQLKTDTICFLHTFGCEGWFNADKNQIHVRTVESSKRNTVESVMHELLHLITYKPNMSFQAREDLVEKYINLPSFQQLLLNI